MSFTDRLGLTIPQAVLAWALVVLIGGAAGLLAVLICNYMLSLVEAIQRVNTESQGSSDSSRWCRNRRLHDHALGYQAYSGLYLPLIEEALIMGACLAFL